MASHARAYSVPAAVAGARGSGAGDGCQAGAAGAEEVNAVRKAREVAFPSVKLMPAPGVNPVKAPQDGTTMSAVAEKAEPTAGLLTL